MIEHSKDENAPEISVFSIEKLVLTSGSSLSDSSSHARVNFPAGFGISVFARFSLTNGDVPNSVDFSVNGRPASRGTLSRGTGDYASVTTIDATVFEVGQNAVSICICVGEQIVEHTLLAIDVRSRETNGPLRRFSPERYDVSIDRITSDFSPDRTIPKGFVAIVSGNAFDNAFETSPERLLCIVDESKSYEAVGGFASQSGRPDAFVGRFSTKDLEPGAHTVRVVAESVDRSEYASTPLFAFTVETCEAYLPITSHAPTWAPAMIDWADRPPSIVAKRPEHRSIVAGEPIHVRGWAVDSEAADSAATIYLSIDNETMIEMESRQARPDVAASFGFPEAVYCGFVGSIQTSGLAPGPHIGRCFIVSKNYRSVYRTEAVLMFDIVPS